MISILTVNYHSADQLANLIGSARANPPSEPWEIIITNNSPEESLSSIEVDPNVRLVPSTNVGFAAGINLALRMSRGDLLMIANPDVQVTRGALDDAAAALRSMHDVGIILPRLRYPDGETQLSVRRFYTWSVILYARSPLRRLKWMPAFFRRYLYQDEDTLRAMDVDWGLGGAMFIRRADVEASGVFDERFFLYFEDVDLCLRMWQRGLRVRYLPEVECVHAHRRSSRNPFSFAGWQHFRSMIRFIIKHRGLPQRSRR